MNDKKKDLCIVTAHLNRFSEPIQISGHNAVFHRNFRRKKGKQMDNKQPSPLVLRIFIYVLLADICNGPSVIISDEDVAVGVKDAVVSLMIHILDI